LEELGYLLAKMDRIYQEEANDGNSMGAHYRIKVRKLNPKKFRKLGADFKKKKIASASFQRKIVTEIGTEMRDQ
jgi:hypothetical protein